MRSLYFDCSMGAAGDMLVAALTELLPDPRGFLQELEGLNIPGVKVSISPSVKCGIKGSHFSVTVHDGEEDEELHEHHHHHDFCHSHEHHSHGDLHEIYHRIQHLPVSPEVAKDILEVYELLAEAESKVHGVPISQIHFHEVGSLDALTDITAVCMLIHKLAPQRIYASPIHVGSGQVKCAHGLLPVPAPATAEILKGIPIYGGSIQSELCTPTGAALLKHFVDKFCPMPPLTPLGIGYGMGKKDFPAANCVRAILAQEEDTKETVVELSCNLDDMSPEHLSFATQLLMEEGALDVYTTAIGMKKNRPATLLSVLCKEEDKEKLVALMFRHTTTLGIREQSLIRHILDRIVEKVDSPLGTVRRKYSYGYGSEHRKYEFEDLAELSKEHSLSLQEVLDQLP